MTRRRVFLSMAIIALGFSLSSTVPSAWGQGIPKGFVFSGKLKGAAGSPVADGAYSITFRIFDAPTGGTKLWEEAREVQVIGGHFELVLGQVTPLSLPFDKPYFLEMEVAGEVLTPRKPLTPAPYAFSALQAQQAQSAQVADTVKDGAVTSAKIADGSVKAVDVDITSIQVRVSGACPAGSAIKAVNQDGTVICEVIPGSLTAGTAVTNLDGSAAVGTALSYAREDHKHGIAAGAIQSSHLAAGAVAGGTGGTIADGTITAADIDATTVQVRVSGACAPGSAIKEVAQDGTVFCETIPGALTAASTVVDLDGAAGAVGTFTSYAREDHKHGIAAGAIQSSHLAAGSVAGGTGGTIADGTITDADISTAAAIAQTKIAGGPFVVQSPGAAQTVQPTADATGLIVRGNASQTAPIFEVQDSAGTRFLGVMADGHVIVDNLLHLKSVDNQSPSGPMGDITVDVLSATPGANTMLQVINSGTEVVDLGVEGNVLVSGGTLDLTQLTPGVATIFNNGGDLNIDVVDSTNPRLVNIENSDATQVADLQVEGAVLSQGGVFQRPTPGNLSLQTNDALTTELVIENVGTAGTNLRVKGGSVLAEGGLLDLTQPTPGVAQVVNNGGDFHIDVVDSANPRLVKILNSSATQVADLEVEGKITTDAGTKTAVVTDGPTPLLMQSGNDCEVLAGDGIVTVTFPVAFSAVPQVVGMLDGNGSTSPASVQIATPSTDLTASSVVFTLSGQSVSTVECVRWIAIGSK